MTHKIFSKSLRDGAELTIFIVPEGPVGWWLEMRRNGAVLAKNKNLPRLMASPVGDLTYGIAVTSKTSVGLTAAEAAAIEDAVTAYVEQGKAAIEAERDSVLARVPGAPTTTFDTGDRYGVGQTYQINGRVVTVLAVKRRYVPEDGWSFGLAAESGYVNAVTVRDATEEEAAAVLGAEAAEAVELAEDYVGDQRATDEAEYDPY